LCQGNSGSIPLLFIVLLAALFRQTKPHLCHLDEHRACPFVGRARHFEAFLRETPILIRFSQQKPLHPTLLLQCNQDGKVPAWVRCPT
jgi:hypothetical protein